MDVFGHNVSSTTKSKKFRTKKERKIIYNFLGWYVDLRVKTMKYGSSCNIKDLFTYIISY